MKGSREGDFDVKHNVQAGKHFYQFYKTTDDYLKILLPFFRSGLEKGEACLWLVSEKMGVSAVAAIAEAGIPHYLYYVCSGQLMITSGEKWYLKNGRFNEAQALSNASNYIERVFKRGFHRLRGAGDSASIPRRDWPKLHAYETKVGAMVKAAPVTALCTYPILECSLQQTRMVIDVHDDVLIGTV